MSSENLTYTPRLPRHPVVDAAGVDVAVMTAAAPPIPVEMLDFSRRGMRFASSLPFALGDEIQVRLRLGSAGALEWTFAGVLRWVQPEPGDQTQYGCEFVETVTWEQLGELLLHGVLSPD